MITHRWGTNGNSQGLVAEPAYGIGKEAFSGGEKANYNFSVNEEVAPTIQAAGAGAVAEPVSQKPFGIGSYSSEAWKSDNPKAGIYEAETARTLDQSGGSPVPHQGGMAIVETYAMTTGYYTQVEKEKTPSLLARDYKDPTVINDKEDESADYRVRRLTPTECARLQGFPDWWCSDLGTENPTDEEIAFWMDVFEDFRKAARYEKLAERISAIQREKDDRECRAKRISLFMRMLARQEECLEFDPALFTAFVEKVVVSGKKKDVKMVFVLRDGSEYRVDGVR